MSLRTLDGYQNEIVNSRIVIILASFNGARFLGEQLESLIKQTESQWSLIIRDDGSTDNTLEIIQDYSRKDNRIQVISDEEEHTKSALGNFSILLESAYAQGARYVFCCDQDDVWEPDKLSLVLSRMKQLEGEGDLPCLVHHDLFVVNEALEPVADSFVSFMKLRPGDQVNPQRLLSRNEVTGCAMACNRALLDIALPVSEQAIMHDWWLALCAGYFGALEFMPQRLVKYRQHADNSIGAKSFWHGLNPLTNWMQGWRRGNSEFICTIKQANAFKHDLKVQLRKHNADFFSLELYTKLQISTRLQRMRALRKCKLWRNQLLLDMVLVLRMLLLPRKSR